MIVKYFLIALSLLSLSNVATAQLKFIEYKLDNGFTVILNPDKTSNTIYGAVAVNTGSKNDPSDATGISHYLEHLLFKGTAELGTHNFEMEKPHLDSINYYYDELGKTTDEEKREKIQLLINKHSVEASKYAMPNEFDKMLKTIGSTKINATTSNDLTIYFNEFPSHQIEKWLDLYAHRFQDPVFRSFQSELEVVYEEKNRAMDNMQRRLFTAFSEEFYKGHPYGDKGTLGTIEHLKNPSLTKMYQYFNTYYVANNMALILSGNFDPETVKPIIEDKFGKLKKGIVPTNKIQKPFTINGRQVKNDRLTPIKVGVIGFRTVAGGHEDELALDLSSSLLQNESGTGFIDQLQKDGKLMMAWSFSENMDEAGNQYFIYIPKILIQSLKGAERQMLAQVERLKTGDFSDKLLLSIKNEMYKNYQLSIEDPSNRVYRLANLFRRGKSLDDIENYPERLDAITKEDVQRVAKKYFNQDYFILQSRTGFPKKTKLKKPKFKPVQVDQSKESVYAKRFKNIPETDLQERFIDFEADLEQMDIKGNKLYVVKNPINDIYELKIQYHFGEFADANCEVIASLLNLAHPKEKTASEFREEIALLGSTFYFESGSNYFSINITGIEKNLKQVLKMLDSFIQEPIVDEKDFKLMVNNLKTGRKAEKEEPMIIARALAHYGIYGNNSISKNRPSAKAVSKMSYTDLMNQFSEIRKHKTSIHFTGKTNSKSIKSILKENFTFNENGPSLVPFNTQLVNRSNNEIFIIDNKKLVQTSMFFVKNSTLFNQKQYAPRNLFNAYFSGGFSGILTQEIREYRSLAYASSAKFQFNYNPQMANYFYTYIGCQADKTNDAVEIALDLINNMPKKEDRFEMVKSSVILSQNAAYPNFRELSTTVEALQIQGYKQDPNINANKTYPKMNFGDIVNFHQQNLKEQKTFLGIYGDTKQFDIDQLKKLGTVKEIKVEDVIEF
jgi:predicted Zn-dependent peptidase